MTSGSALTSAGVPVEMTRPYSMATTMAMARMASTGQPSAVSSPATMRPVNAPIMIVFQGQLSKPGYITIEDDKISFHDAAHLWGRGSHETEGILAKKYGYDYSIMSIGQAGENLSNMACINSDYYRQAGRGGIGAVMGSKKIKAILIKGTGGVKVPDIKKCTDRIIEIMHEQG